MISNSLFLEAADELPGLGGEKRDMIDDARMIGGGASRGAEIIEVGVIDAMMTR
jgi:hypothetical protein